MPRFYVDAPLRVGGGCVLAEEAAHHALQVMRLRAGDALTLFDGRGGEYAGRISAAERKRVSVEILTHHAVERESPLRMVLVQGVSSAERMDFTVRKAVELGVAEIHPVLASRSVARPRGERAENRRAHWQKIVISACEQCGRNRIPEVEPLLPVETCLGTLKTDASKLLLSPRSELRLSKVDAAPGYLLAVGPEGGFDADEEAAFAGAGFVPVRLGARVLRTETAALAALAALSALRGDF